MKLLDLILSADLYSKVLGGVIVAVLVGTYKYLRDHLRNRQLRKRLEEDRYTPAEIKKKAADDRDTYVPPDCQDNNPASSGPDVSRRPIFQEVDQLLGPPQLTRFILILADTGMGKSTFLRRYYTYHWRSPERNRRFKSILVPMIQSDANELIDEIKPQHRGETVLLLDALDEDNAAISNFGRRFNDLAKLAGKFRAIVVTCRTQFLPDAYRAPMELDISGPSGPTPLSGGPDRSVHQLYLAPFSDTQVKKYLAARFPYWHHPILRVRATRAAHRFKDLMSRPLLLTFIQDLASSSEEPRYSFQVYGIIVESWLRREMNKNRLTISPENLLRFSEEFAVSLFATGRDRATIAELQSMAERFGVEPVFREVRERSLLHNDAEGNWKFVHRSIMEYLLVSSIGRNSLLGVRVQPPWVGQQWTDQMRGFAREMLMSGEYKRLPGADLHGLNLKGIDLSAVDLTGANLSDADVTGARLVFARLDHVTFQRTCLDRTLLGGVDLGKVRGLTLLQAINSIADQNTIWPVRTLASHSAGVNSVTVTPDGRRAISASFDRTLKVWDLETGAELRTLAGHSASVNSVAVTPDGRRAVSASRDRTVKVWDLETWSNLCTLRAHSNLVDAVAVMPDGRNGISASPDHPLMVWNLETGGELRTLPAQPGWVRTLDVTPDGRRADSVSRDTTFDFGGLETGGELGALAGQHSSLCALVVTPDGQRAVVSGADHTLNVWDLATGKKVRALMGHEDAVNAVAVTPDGRRAISASSDRTLKVWDLESGSNLRTLTGHTNAVNAVAVTPDGRNAVSGSDDKTLKVWDLETGDELRTLTGHSGSIRSVAVTADGRSIVSASEDKTLRVWFPSDETDSARELKRSALNR